MVCLATLCKVFSKTSRVSLWVGTDNRLAEFTPGTRSVRSYYASDGLAGSEFNYWGAVFQDTGGEMFFPGVSGLSVFHPGKIAKNRYVPRSF